MNSVVDASALNGTRLNAVTDDPSLDLAELAAIDDLALLARIVVAPLGAGVQRSAHTGTSAEFAQYRPYTQGDDTRFVDWKLYGQSDRLHIRQFTDETSMRCTVLLDCSGSMEYGSGDATKFQYARMLAAGLILLSSQQRGRAGRSGTRAWSRRRPGRPRPRPSAGRPARRSWRSRRAARGRG